MGIPLSRAQMGGGLVVEVEGDERSASKILDCELTDRQKEILLLVYQRLSSKEIGRRLGISPKTVDAHLQTARQQLGCSTRIQAARVYWESLPRERFPMSEMHQGVPDGGTAQEEGPTGENSVFQPPKSHWPDFHGRTPWPEPSSLGPGKRIALILAGAITILLLMGAATALMSGIYALLIAILGEPRPG